MSLEKMTPPVRQALTPIVQKWQAFVPKFQGRVQEVEAEANAGLDQLIAAHATDHGPMGAAFGALQARFNGLTTKLSDAWEKIDNQMDEALDELDDQVTSADWEAWSALRDAMVNQEREILEATDVKYQEIEMRKNADWSRRLRELAQQEIQKGAPCSECGSPFPIKVYWQASQEMCPHCNAVIDVQPGMAAGLFHQGLGAHSLAQEAAWGEWMAERKAKNAFDARRCPTAYDHWLYLQAAHAYYTRYYQEGLKVHPGFTENVEQAVAAKMQHYTAWDQPIQKQQRDYFGQLVDYAGKGMVNELQALLTQRPHHIDLDDCGYALVERGLLQAAEFVYTVKYTEDGEDGSKKAYAQEQIRDAIKILR
ncbi:MAG: hypothetical protein AAGF12_30770 [Myxococcota bacterium]